MRGYVDPDVPNPGGPNDASFIIFGYRPSLAFASVAIATFGILAVCHGYYVVRSRPRYWLMVVLACVLEIVGYAFRILAHVDPYDVRWFVVQYFMLVVSPVLYSATIYANLCTLLQGRWILSIFVTADVVTTIAQIAGAAGIGASESNEKDPSKFNDVLIAGLAIQSASTLVFLAILVFYIVDQIGSGSRPKISFKLGARRASKRQLYCLLLAALLVFARTIFRLGEAGNGVLGPASSNEILFALLDYFPIILAVIVLLFTHPGDYHHITEVPMSRNSDKVDLPSWTTAYLSFRDNNPISLIPHLRSIQPQKYWCSVCTTNHISKSVLSSWLLIAASVESLSLKLLHIGETAYSCNVTAKWQDTFLCMPQFMNYILVQCLPDYLLVTLDQSSSIFTTLESFFHLEQCLGRVFLWLGGSSRINARLLGLVTKLWSPGASMFELIVLKQIAITVWRLFVTAVSYICSCCYLAYMYSCCNPVIEHRHELFIDLFFGVITLQARNSIQK